MTLIELILVMGLMAMMFAMAAPKLSRFADGRALREESRRFIALTRYARNLAISRAVPIALWIDPEEAKYGLTPQIEYESETNMPVEYYLATGLEFDLGEAELDENGRASMLFWPDGVLGEDSIEEIWIVENEDRALGVIQAGYGLGYYLEENSDEHDAKR